MEWILFLLCLIILYFFIFRPIKDWVIDIVNNAFFPVVGFDEIKEMKNDQKSVYKEAIKLEICVKEEKKKEKKVLLNNDYSEEYKNLFKKMRFKYYESQHIFENLILANELNFAVKNSKKGLDEAWNEFEEKNLGSKGELEWKVNAEKDFRKWLKEKAVL